MSRNVSEVHVFQVGNWDAGILWKQNYMVGSIWEYGEFGCGHNREHFQEAGCIGVKRAKRI